MSTKSQGQYKFPRPGGMLGWPVAFFRMNTLRSTTPGGRSLFWTEVSVCDSEKYLVAGGLGKKQDLK